MSEYSRELGTRKVKPESFFRYPPGDRSRDFPQRVYALIDSIEFDSYPPRPRAYYLDCVNANWFDEVWHGQPLANPESEYSAELEEHVSIIEIDADELRIAAAVHGTRSWLALEFYPDYPELRSGAFSSEVESSEVHQYPNLFDAPVVRRVQGVPRYVGRAQARRLNKAFEIDLPDAPEPAIRAALEPASIAAGIAIYDVGQGNCNAILNESGYPSLYFDVGGGVAQNRHTFPAALQRFCVQQGEQTIVLSHWDHDHWSSAVRFPELQKLRWIIPRQRLGGKHAAFLSSLRAKAGEANVLVWPEHLSHLQVGDVTVIRCSGPRTDRNRSGLALIIEPKHRNLRKRVLLPGDCPYRYIDAGADAYTSLVVSHHGGRTDRRKTAAVPRSDGDSCGRLVYSVGSGNSYNHPLPDVMASHAASWGTSRLTTKRRGKVGLGHVHLYWDNADPDIQLLCGGTGCDLVCYQR